MNFNVLKIDPSDNNVLKNIFQFRVMCRHEEGYITKQKFPNGWYDETDKASSHFVILKDDYLIGASRVTFYNKMDCHPYWNSFRNLKFLEEKEKIAYLSRVVVHPKYRLLGLAKKMRTERIEYAKSLGYTNIYLDTTSSNIDKFSKDGWINLGMLETDNIEWDLNPDHFLFYKKIV